MRCFFPGMLLMFVTTIFFQSMEVQRNYYRSSPRRDARKGGEKNPGDQSTNRSVCELQSCNTGS